MKNIQEFINEATPVNTHTIQNSILYYVSNAGSEKDLDNRIHHILINLLDGIDGWAYNKQLSDKDTELYNKLSDIVNEK